MVTVRNVKVFCQVVKPIQSTFNVHLRARLMRIPSLTHSWLAGGSSGGGSPEPQKLSKPTVIPCCRKTVRLKRLRDAAGNIEIV
jgi:hypothetical protein